MSISWTLTYIFLTNTLYTPILSQFQPFPASRYKVHKNLRQQTYLFCRRRCIDSLLIQRDDSDTTFRRTTFHIQWGNPIGSNAGPIRTIRQPPTESNRFQVGNFWIQRLQKRRKIFNLKRVRSIFVKRCTAFLSTTCHIGPESIRFASRTHRCKTTLLIILEPSL